MNSSSVAQPAFVPINRLFNPALLLAVGLHALVLAIPLSGGSKPTEPKTEESPTAAESQIAEFPSSVASPNATAIPSAQLKTPALKSPAVNARSPLASPTPRQSTASSRAKTSPRSPRPSTHPKTTSRTASTAARDRSNATKPNSNATPENETRDRSRETTPTFSNSTSNATQPPPTPQTTLQPVALNPSPVAIDPFSKFPFYPFERSLIGSLGLRPPGMDRETYAFNTREELSKVIEFYQNEIPQDLFEPLALKSDGTDLTVYEVKPKNGGKSQYLHLIPFQGRVAIVLLPEQLADVDSLKKQAIAEWEEQKQFLHILSQMERIRQQFSLGR